MYIARLREIKANIYDHNGTLYRACANANPHNMNEAMIGISKEVSALIIWLVSLLYNSCDYCK